MTSSPAEMRRDSAQLREKASVVILAPNEMLPGEAAPKKAAIPSLVLSTITSVSSLVTNGAVGIGIACLIVLGDGGDDLRWHLGSSRAIQIGCAVVPNLPLQGRKVVPVTMYVKVHDLLLLRLFTQNILTI